MNARTEFAAELKRRAEHKRDLLSNTLAATRALIDAASDLDNAARELLEAKYHIEEALNAAHKLDPDTVEELENPTTCASGTNHDLTEDQRLDMPRTL